MSSLQTGINDPGILALDFIEKVDLVDRADFISKTTLEHNSSFRIHPQGDRPDYFVVRFVEPIEINIAALGFDIGSEPARRETAGIARDSGRAVLTPRIELVQTPGKLGAILLEAVYSGGGVPTSIAERRSQLQGWVYAAFVVEDMMTGVRQLTNSPLRYEIFDDSHPSAQHLICATSMDAGDTRPSGLDQCTTLNIQIPIVFLTAAVRHAEVDSHHGSFGGMRFLSKPVSLPELTTCLNEVLAGRHQHA